jgi:hypothetical protein
MHYSYVSDSLLELILEKLAQKSIEFLEILVSDISKSPFELQKLESMLVRKSESLAKAVFEMNKMKWLKELSISNPDEGDMATIEDLQIRLKRLRDNPTSRDIGEFCKHILTVEQLVD